MKWLREAFSTLLRLIRSGPFGRGPVFDEHSKQAVGDDR